MLLSEGQTYEVFLTDVNFSKDAELTIWVQADEENQDAFNQLTETLQCEAPTLKPVSDVQKGKLCACRFEDDQQWYRAKVEERLACGKWLIHFVDYGNSQALDGNELHDLPLHLGELPGQATALILDDSLLPTGSAGLWTPAVGKIILDAFAYNNVSIKVVKLCEKVVKVNCQAINDVLIERGLAAAGLSHPYAKFCVGGKFKSYVSNITLYGSLFLQEIETSLELDKLMDEIAAYYCSANNKLSLPKKDFKVGSLVAAIYSHDLGYYRAQITSIDGDSCTVHFIDYGDSEQQETTTVFVLPKEFWKLDYQGIECQLHDVTIFPDKYSKALKNVLHDRVADQLVEMEIMEHISGSSVKLSVKVRYEGENVCEPLLAEGFAKIRSVPASSASEIESCYKHSKIELGSEYHMVVAHVEKDGVFYVSSISDCAKLDKLMDELAQHCNDPATLSLTDINDGQPCLALYNADNNWYRALIKSHDVSNVIVWYVDYGNTAVCNMLSLKQIKPEFLDLPRQAIECHVLKELDDVEISKLQSLTDQEVTVKFLVKGDDSDSYGVKVTHDGSALFLPLPKESIAESSPFLNDLEYKTRKIQIGFSEEVIITCVSDVDSIWVRLQSCENEFKTVLDQLREVYSTNIPADSEPCPPERGSLCVVRDFETGLWYRGKVLNMPGKMVFSVLLVDVGKVQDFNGECIQPLTSEFLKLPALAVRCSLASIVQNFDGSGEQISKLRELLHGKLFEATFTNYEASENLCSVELRHPNGLPFNSIFSKSSSTTTSPEHASHKEVERSSSLHSIYSSCSSFGTFVDVAVCFVQDPECMWIQQRSNEAQLFNLLTEMKTFYGNLPARDLLLNNPEVDDLCAIKSKRADSDHWYRGRVLCTYGNIIEVKMIDFGSEVKSSREDIRRLALNFFQPKAQALKCKLFNVKPAAKMWSNSAVRRLCELTKAGSKVSGKFIEKQNLSYLVDLALDVDGRNTTISSLLVEEKHAAWVEEPTTDEHDKDPDTCGTTRMANKTKRLKLFYHSPGMAMVGAEIEVSVCEVTSPDDFFLRIKDSNHQQSYVKLFRHMAEYYNTEKMDMCVSPDNLYIGMPCAVLYSKSGEWCRGAVLHFSDVDNLKVCLVDFGCVVSCKLDVVRTITTSFVTNAPPAAMRCTLRGIIEPKNGCWSSAALDLCYDFFEKNKRNMSCTIHGCAGDDLGTYFMCSIRTPLLSIADELVDAGFGVKPSAVGCLQPPLKLKSFVYSNLNVVKGKEDEFYITHIEGPELFYCQLPRQFQIIDSMMDDLQQQCADDDHTLVSPEDLARDCMCFARYASQQWYRAHFIAAAPSGSVKVMFVDYGNTETVDIKDVRRFSNGKFFELPIQALPCSLEDVVMSSASGAQQNKVFNLMQEILNEKQFNGVVAGSTNGKLHLDLLDGGKRINDVIVKEAMLQSPIVVSPPIMEGDNLFELDSTGSIDLSEPFFLRVGAQELVSVSDFTNPRHFYVQFEKLADELELCKSRVDGYYTAVRNSDYSVSALHPGDTVCARQGADLKWRRATVLSVSEPYDEYVEVVFVDCGAVENVVKSFNVKKLVKKMAVWPKMAVPCSLAGVRPLPTDKWSQKAKLQFQCATNNMHQLIAHFLHKDQHFNTWLVRLGEGEDDIAADLVDLGLAIYDQDECKAFNISTKPISVVIEPACKFHDDEKVFISQVVSSNKVFLQRAEELPKIDALMLEINEDKHLQTLSDIPEKGTFCLARYDLDRHFYRAVVLEKMISDCEGQALLNVLFVDYGNRSAVSFSDIRKISKKFSSLSQGAILCKLSDIPEETGEIATKLDDLAISEDVTILASFEETKEHFNAVKLKIKLPEVTAVSLHKFLFDTEEVDSAPPPDVPGNAELPKYKEIENVMDQSNRKVYVSHVENPGHLFIQFADCCNDLDAMMHSIEAYYKKDRPEDRFASDSLSTRTSCIAKYTGDGCWYRAEILEVCEGDTVKVRFVDYGNSEIVALDCIRHSKVGFCILPIQAIHCHLAYVNTDQSSWTAAETNAFDGRVATLELTASFSRVVNEQDKIYEVMLRLPDGTLLNKEYMQNGQSSGTSTPKPEEKDEVVNDVEAEDEKSLIEKVSYVDQSEIALTVDRIGGNDLIAEVVVPSITIEVGMVKQCYVSYAENPSNFFVQLSQSEADLDSIYRLTTLDAEKESSQRKERFSLGSYCVARSPDDNEWYRGQITKIGEKVTISFIDYGNSSTVSLDEVKDMSKSTSDVPEQAISCHLSQVPKFSGEEEIQKAVDIFLESVMDTKLDVKFLEKQPSGKWKVSLHNEGVDVAEKLQVLCQKTTNVENDCQKTDCDVALVTEAGLSAVNAFSPAAISTPNLPDIIVTDTEGVPNFPSEDAPLKPGVETGAKFHIENVNGLATLNDCLKFFRRVCDNVKMSLSKSLPTEVIVQQINDVLAVIDASEQAASSHDSIGADGDHKAIPDDHKRPSSVRNYFAGPRKKPRLDKSSLASTGTPVIYHSIPEQDEDEESSDDQMLELPKQPIKRGDIHEAFVWCVENPNHFFVKPCFITGKIPTSINTSTLIPLDNTDNQSLCVFHSGFGSTEEDLLRGVISSQTEDQLVVIDIDSGFKYTLTPDKVYKLPDEYKTCSPLAVNCSLNAEPIGGEWSAEACKYFSELLEDTIESIRIEFLNHCKSECWLRKWTVNVTINSVSASDLLVSNKFATAPKSNVSLEQEKENITEKTKSKGQTEKMDGNQVITRIPLLDIAKLASSQALVSFSYPSPYSESTAVKLNSTTFIMSTNSLNVPESASSLSMMSDSVFTTDEERSAMMMPGSVDSPKLAEWKIYHSSTQTPHDEDRRLPQFMQPSTGSRIQETETNEATKDDKQVTEQPTVKDSATIVVGDLSVKKPSHVEEDVAPTEDSNVNEVQQCVETSCKSDGPNDDEIDDNVQGKEYPISNSDVVISEEVKVVSPSDLDSNQDATKADLLDLISVADKIVDKICESALWEVSAGPPAEGAEEVIEDAAASDPQIEDGSVNHVVAYSDNRFPSFVSPNKNTPRVQDDDFGTSSGISEDVCKDKNIEEEDVGPPALEETEDEAEVCCHLEEDEVSASVDTMKENITSLIPPAYGESGNECGIISDVECENKESVDDNTGSDCLMQPQVEENSGKVLCDIEESVAVSLESGDCVPDERTAAFVVVVDDETEDSEAPKEDKKDEEIAPSPPNNDMLNVEQGRGDGFTSPNSAIGDSSIADPSLYSTPIGDLTGNEICSAHDDTLTLIDDFSEDLGSEDQQDNELLFVSAIDNNEQ